MTRRQSRLLMWIGVALVVMGAMLLLTSRDVSDAGPCQEDMACWDCETMGNEICGKEFND